MRVKICGICSAEDAREAERLGGDFDLRAQVSIQESDHGIAIGESLGTAFRGASGILKVRQTRR